MLGDCTSSVRSWEFYRLPSIFLPVFIVLSIIYIYFNNFCMRKVFYNILGNQGYVHPYPKLLFPLIHIPV